MMKLKMTSDLSKLDAGLRNLTPTVDKTIGESVESIVNRIHANWSASSPSSPGQPPAVVTGNLDENVVPDKTGRNSLGQFAKGSDVIVQYIHVKADYANALELGDPSKNLAPRPFVAPAVLDEEAEIGNRFAISFGGVWK